MNALLIFWYLKTTQALINAIVIVRQSVMASLPIVKQTEAMIATEATLTASRKADKLLYLRILFISGLSNATKINDGRNMAIVISMAPDNPLI